MMRGCFGIFDRVRSSTLPSWVGVVFALPLTLSAGPWQTTLAPGDPALPEPGVPWLSDVVAEHRLSGDGLSLVPGDGPYAWSRTGPTAEPFRLLVSVEASHYDRATLSVWNWHNTLVRQWTVEPGKEHEFAIGIDGLGSYLLTLDGWKDGFCSRRLIRNLAVTRDLNTARDTWKKDEFFVGICAFPGRYHWKPGGDPTLPAGLSEEQARNLEASLIARTGLQVVRTDESLEMGRRKAKAGEEEFYFDFSRMDAAVGSWTSRGFQLVLQTMNSADWAVLPQYEDQGKNRWRYPHQEKPQRAYLAALVERYGEHARFAQVSNEPDQIGYWSGTNEEFVAQYRFSLDEIRRVAPRLPVTQGGYSLVDEAKCAYFIRELRGLIDLPAYNAHGNLADYKRSFATMRRLQAGAGETLDGWVNTEAGYSAWRLDQERRQAQVDTQKVLYSWANGHAGILLFCSRMTRGPGRDGPPDFGLVDYQYCPRFVYAAVSALTGTLTNSSFHETLVESEGEHLYVFKKGTDLIVAGFHLGETSATARLAHDGKEVVFVDEMGNEASIDATGTLTVNLDGYPRYWILRDATTVTQTK